MRQVTTKLALLGFGLCAALLLGEILVRVLGLAPDSNVVAIENYQLASDPLLRYELVPGSRDGQTHISSAGLRDKEYAQPKPPGVFRILVVGDSIVFGFGVAQGDPISEQLEDLLSGQHTSSIARFEVLNLGVTGYNITQVVEMLRTRGLAFQPDLIIYGYCLNDPQDYSFELEQLKAKLSPAQRSYRADALRRGRQLLDHSRLLMFVRYALRTWGQRQTTTAPRDLEWSAVSSRSYADHFEQLYGTEGLARLQQGIAALKKLEHDAGVPLVTAIFPLFVDLDQYRLGRLHERVAALFRVQGLRSYDLLPVYSTMLRRHGPLFVSNALHPNPLGHRLAALYMLRALTRDGLLPSTQRTPGPARESDQLDRLLEPVIAAAQKPAEAPP